jgi:hypothetical protein
MLSRVAERIYWLGRYLERAENTARLLTVYSTLLLDLPRGAKIGWHTLVEITGSRPGFDEKYQDTDERSVIRFLLSDHQQLLLHSEFSGPGARERPYHARDHSVRSLGADQQPLSVCKGKCQQGCGPRAAPSTVESDHRTLPADRRTVCGHHESQQRLQLHSHRTQSRSERT